MSPEDSKHSKVTGWHRQNLDQLQQCKAMYLLVLIHLWQEGGWKAGGRVRSMHPGLSVGSGAASFLSWWNFTLRSLLCCGLVCWTSGFYPCLSIWTYGDIMFSNSSLYGPVNSVTAHYTDISLTRLYLNKTPIYVSNSQGVWELGRQRNKDSGSGIKFLYSEFCLPLECC